jgi:hypothetical protein
VVLVELVACCGWWYAHVCGRWQPRLAWRQQCSCHGYRHVQPATAANINVCRPYWPHHAPRFSANAPTYSFLISSPRFLTISL